MPTEEALYSSPVLSMCVGTGGSVFHLDASCSSILGGFILALMAADGYVEKLQISDQPPFKPRLPLQCVIVHHAPIEKILLFANNV